MNITYNNIESPSNMLTFTEVPNILKVSEIVDGTKSTLQLVFDGDLRVTVTADSQYYITVFGETITNVMDASKAKNKRFFISSDEDSTSMSVARALRNCASIAADYNIIHTGSSVILYAKTVGEKFSNVANYVQRNIDTQFLNVYGFDGSVWSDFLNSKIDVDVYKDSTRAYNYVTTLEKNWYGNECAFDMSPVLSTLSEYGTTTPYVLSLQLIQENGEYRHLGEVSGNTTIGFHANQSEKYLTTSGVKTLLNKNRGNDGTMTLYTYSNVIDYSVLCGLNTASWNLEVSVKDSAFNEIYKNQSLGQRASTNMIVDSTITIPQTAFTAGYYVDLTVGGETTRFNIIKPLKATEYYQRILWRNEYGGISFFDFTGSKSESDSVDVETYEKNIFDYYETTHFERKRIYSNDYKKKVSLKSHLMEEDGKWIFNSLMRSKKVWTTVNGKTYYIIPTSIEVEEDQTYNNIFTAKLQYEYSDI